MAIEVARDKNGVNDTLATNASLFGIEVTINRAS